MFLKKSRAKFIVKETEHEPLLSVQKNADPKNSDEEEVTFKAAISAKNNQRNLSKSFSSSSSISEQELVFQSNLEGNQESQMNEKKNQLKNMQKQSLDKTNMVHFKGGKDLINPIYVSKLNRASLDQQFDLSKFTFVNNDESQQASYMLNTIVMKQKKELLSEQFSVQLLIQNKCQKQQTDDFRIKPSNSTDQSEREIIINDFAVSQNAFLKPYQIPLNNLDISNLEYFLKSPAPKGGLIQCTIIRDKSAHNKSNPTYKFMLSEGNRILMTAKQSVIRMVYSQKATQNQQYLGKIISSEGVYAFFDDGVSPSSCLNNVQIRQEIGTVIYDLTIDHFKQPSYIKILLPRVNEKGNQIQIFQSIPNKESIFVAYSSQNLENLDLYVNRKPIWDNQIGGFVLDFLSRVKRGSKKNFQLLNATDLRETICLQFGKVDKNLFNLDFLYPLSPLQAFMIALTSFQFNKKK